MKTPPNPFALFLSYLRGYLLAVLSTDEAIDAFEALRDEPSHALALTLGATDRYDERRFRTVDEVARGVADLMGPTHEWRRPAAGEPIEEDGICVNCGVGANSATASDIPCVPPHDGINPPSCKCVRCGRSWLEANHGLKPGTLTDSEAAPAPPLAMILFCPHCHALHVDAPEPKNGWTNPPHKSHQCHTCRIVFRPADIATTGVAQIATRGERDTWPITDAPAHVADAGEKVATRAPTSEEVEAVQARLDTARERRRDKGGASREAAAFDAGFVAARPIPPAIHVTRPDEARTEELNHAARMISRAWQRAKDYGIRTEMDAAIARLAAAVKR